MQTTIDLPFADGIYTFRLGLAQIAELQAKCGVGIGGLYARLLRGRYVLDSVALGLATEAEFHLADVIEPIRQGLIGGRRGEVDGAAVDVSSITAARLIENHLCARDGTLRVPLREAWNLAVAITAALVEGYEPRKAGPTPAPMEGHAPIKAGPAAAPMEGSAPRKAQPAAAPMEGYAPKKARPAAAPATGAAATTASATRTAAATAAMIATTAGSTMPAHSPTA